ncbi:MAG: Rrf2 family transcriptional regulator [Candidatus Marinimicrobia bacterium]|nr:Rrf2 family transcriptional regulator [Candidatus Neomarinimicrobiota bacterium]
MSFSKQVQYAIQMLMHLDSSTEKLLTVKEIAAERELPHNFLQKIAQDLAKWDIIESRRGRNGGIKLKRPSHEITVKDIIRVVDGPFGHDCIIGEKSCTTEKMCHVCDHYHSHFAELYYNTSLKDLLIKDHCCK